MNKNILETLTGLLVILVAVFFAYKAVNSSGMEEDKDRNYKLKVNFDRIDGLSINGDVRVSGLKVGKVSAAKIDPKTYLANVTLSVDKSIKIPEDSSAEIISNGLLGDKYVALVPGGAEEYLQDGDLVKYSQSSVSIEALIGKFMFGSSDEEGENGESSADSSGDFF